jgi:hypothetical protein
MAVVGVATTSAEVLRVEKELRPEIVLLDIHLGDESGFELARRLRVGAAPERGNTDGTTARATADWRGYSLWDELPSLGDVRDCGFPRFPSLPASSLKGKDGGRAGSRWAANVSSHSLGFRRGAKLRLTMARRAIGPRRSQSLRTHVRSTRIIAAISVLALAGAVAWDFANDGFWSRHALFSGLVASLIVVAATVAVLNEVLERRQRERWSVLAQYALFELVRTARLVWTGLLELTGLVSDEELEDGTLTAGTDAVLDTPRLAAAMDEMIASPDRREQLHRLIARLHAHGQEVLGRWADVMVNSGTYAEILDRHVELYSRLYWWGSVLDESEPLEEHLNRPRLSRLSPATQTSGPVEDEWLRDNLVAIVQLAESLDRRSFGLAMRIVPIEWWTEQLPDRRPSTT